MIRKSPDRERGAALVEFAVLAPLLILLILGIVEFGWKFGQFNDVRHGAREGGRYAAVDGDGTGNAAIHTRVCEAMDGLSAGITSLTVELTRDASASVGDPGTIRVEATVSSLSNIPLISQFLPSTLASEVEFRIEQPPTWTSDGSPQGVSC